MARKYLTLLATLGFALSAMAFAEENSADLFADAGDADTGSMQSGNQDTDIPEIARPFTLKLSGSHELSYHAPVMESDLNYDGEIKTPALRNDLGIEVQNGNIKLISNWELDLLQNQNDQVDEGNNAQYGSWNSLARVRPLENYISWSPEGFRLSAGYQIFAWGVADKRNPTDNLNPRDYTVGVNADKIPVLAIDAVWYPTDAISLEAVYIPYEQADRWPEDFKEAITGSSLSALGATDNSVSYESLDFSPKSAIPGVKISYRSSVADFSISYLYDYDQYYTPVIKTTAGPPYFIDSISLERKRIHRFGADAKTTAGTFGLWFEGAYSLTENSGADDWSTRRSKFDYTAGLDTNFGPNDSYYVNFQLIGSWIPGYNSSYGDDYSNVAILSKITDKDYMLEFYQRSTVDGLGFDNQEYLQGASVNLKFDLLDSLVVPQVTAVYMVPFKYDDSTTKRLGSLALNPEFDFMPVDSFHIKIGADLYYAWIKEDGDVKLDDEKDMIGIFTPSNNVYVKVAYKWNYDLKK